MHPFDPGFLSSEFTGLYVNRAVYSQTRQIKIQQFRDNQAKRCAELSKQIENKTYCPNYRGVLIPQFNPDGTLKKNRGITPLSPTDWLVQRILLRLLVDAVGDEFATAVSFGRKASRNETARSPAACCIELGLARRTRPYGVRADLINFFPSVNRTLVLERIRRVLEPDWTWHWLLERMIMTDARPHPEATQSEAAKFWPANQGVHQGTVLAPFLANVFMADWDLRWGQKTSLFRYVDDWIVLGKSNEEVQGLALAMKESLPNGAECHLDNQEKAEQFNDSEKIHFLGLAGLPDGRVQPSDASLTRHKTSVKEKAAEATDLITLAQSLIRYNEAWKAYYSNVQLSQSIKRLADKEVSAAIDGWLSGRQLGGSVRGEIRKLVVEYHPSADKKVSEAIAFALESGELRPTEVDERIRLMT